MKKAVFITLLLIGVALVGKAFIPARNKGEFDVIGFGRLPVVVNGRVKPLDTVARTSLLVLQSSQYIPRPDGTVLTPTEWLLDVVFASKRADGYQQFEINHPDVLALFSLRAEDGRGGRRFSYEQLQKNISELQRQAQLVEPIDAAVRTPFQKAVVRLYSNVGLYFRLRSSLVAPDHQDFLGELLTFQKNVVEGVNAVRAKQAGKEHDTALVDQMLEFGGRFDRMAELAYLLPVPPDDGEADTAGWSTVGKSLLGTFQTGRLNSSTMVFAGLARTWRADQAKEFNELLGLYRTQLEKSFPNSLKKCAAEARYNAAEPFYIAMMIYVLAFFVGTFAWLGWPDALGRAAFWLVGLAWVVATAGILARMWLEGRPPVTNLYSSALFVGWVAVAACLVLESIYRNAIGSVAAGLVGFSTLLIAYYLSLDGDTLEMMRAVLDSNFWLATHVVTVTAGYGATFLAGFLALIYIVRGTLTTSLDKATADALNRMVYGIVCFATLFSLIGTVLGGIWADQSWGRFWGWDPKENGALIIVIWNAIFLHARWGGMAKARGLMALAVFGNIVTAWSWFGVNMLGVGLHSYGFMDAAFWSLMGFVAVMLGFIALANLPLAKWRSFSATKA
jgi:ABC-type transport system involved in cytochrome c biogenesis permease subunit